MCHHNLFQLLSTHLWIPHVGIDLTLMSPPQRILLLRALTIDGFPTFHHVMEMPLLAILEGLRIDLCDLALKSHGQQSNIPI
jgi:hypothetical protein